MKQKRDAVAGDVGDAPRVAKTALIVPPSPQWYLTELPPLPPRSTSRAPDASSSFLTSTSSRAASLLQADADAYAASAQHTASSSTDARFLRRVLAGGTLSDRLSALTLLVQASPLHNARALESLRSMAEKKSREEALKALRAVVDWWVGGGGPDRKLRYFRDQPLTHPNITDAHLVLWYFEDWLKKYFFSILQLLEGLAVDPLPYVRTQTMNLIFQLLRDKPEQEQNLLRLLVHKLSDADKAIASKASYNLLQLLQPHPQMKNIVIQEVAALILKPDASKEKVHLRYYAVITFNQIVFYPNDRDVAARLVDVYFALFKEVLGEDASLAEKENSAVAEVRDFTPKSRGRKPRKDEKGKKKKGGGKADLGFEEVQGSDAKLVSQILTGINRALPFARVEESATFSGHIDTLFRITHSATFNVSVQALTLLQRLPLPSVADRFYRALYGSLIDPRLEGSSKQAMYLNLLFRALKQDTNSVRTAAFVRRFVQVLASSHQPPFICGGLFLLGELFLTSAEVRDLISVGRTEEGGAEGYDPRKRDPQFSRATNSCLWELVALQTHYHPSVALHARQLLAHEQVTATADLGLHTVGHFIDRFVYRNPRQPRERGTSAMQPGAGGGAGGGVRAGRAGEDEMAVNQAAFLKKREGDVPADQVFFHKYFKRKEAREEARKVKAGRRKGGKQSDGDHGVEDEDEDEEDSDPEEAEIWKAMKASIPGMGGGDVDIDDGAGSILEDDGDEESDMVSDGDASDLDFMEDSDDLLSEAADAPGLLEYDGSDTGSEPDVDEQWEGFGEPGKKRGREEEDQEDNGGEERKKKKKKRRGGLPTFASYDDYAGMIERDVEDDV